MKLVIIMLTVFCVQASARSYAQQISLSENNASLAKVFSSIEKQSGYDFFYKGSLLQNIKVSVHLNNATLQQALSTILKDQPLSYTIYEHMIIIKNKERVATEPVKESANIIAPVTGKVTDNKGQPLPGVTVKLKGSSSVETVTDQAGNYTINLPDNSGTLVYSFLGFVSQEIAVNQHTNIDVKLLEDITGLNQVVVIGYGNVRRKDLTGAVSTIKGETFENTPIISIEQMLQGKAPGLQVTSISGQPGDGVSVRIRGGNSINATNEPLYVVDGIIAGTDFNTSLLNPEDVESIDVLKDASSTAIYGARGANGVIIINTKAGKAGKDHITINSYSGFQQLPHEIPMMTGPQYAALVNEQYISQKKAPYYKNVDSVANTDWQKEITRVAPISSITMQASGGDNRSTYLVSANYTDQEGIILNSGYRRYQFRSNFSRQVLPTVKINTTLNIGNSLTRNNPASLGGLDYYSSALGVAPSMPAYLPNGDFSVKREVNSGNLDNPLAQATLKTNTTNRNNVLGNFGVEWTLIKGLVFKTSFGVQLDFSKNNVYTPGSLPVEKVNSTGGTASVSTAQHTNWTIENTLNYTKTIAKVHSISALVGMTYQNDVVETLSGSSSKFPNDTYTYNNLGATDQTTFGVGSGYTKYGIVSYLGRINYSFNDRYLLTLTGRVDGASNFAVNKKYAVFPAAAFAWRASDEDFMKNQDVISNLKFRLSYGVTGNQGISPYQSLQTLNTARYILGNNNTLGYIQGNYGNPSLKWETTGQYDAGVEFGVLHDRLSFEVDWYSKHTSNLLLSEQLPVQTGYGSLTTNIGSINNRGVEVMINSVNINKKSFNWTSSFNIAFNKNKVLDLGGVNSIFTQSITYAGNVSSLNVGGPVGTFYGATYYGTRKTLDPVPGVVGKNATPTLGEALYLDKNGDGKLGTDDYGVIGDSNPKFFGGLNNTISYKGFQLSTYFSFSYGNKIMNIADAFYASGDPLSNNYAYMVNRWSPLNPNSNIPTLSRDYVPNTRWIYNGSYLRLKTVTLGYNIPGSKFHVRWFKNINVYASSSNLFVITKYPYYDPDTNYYAKSSVSRGFDATNYPQNRNYVLGLKVDF
ncbi:MAG: TonB-dependent receptor [Mucilaginibacter sp.]|uniref:TonB-dependent receptor n=1 Tax=Mucilaginibacter sp. TaxID=1882438 RepID=UPI0031A14AF1